MNGVHDMGGMHGFGPVEREANEPTFHAPWEGRVRAMMSLTTAQGIYNLDAFRFGIERMDPAHYLRSSYFERWLTTAEYNLILKGIVTSDELDARTEQLQRAPETVHVAPAASIRNWSARTQHPQVPAITARFAVGDAVLTRNIHPNGHTRMPRYVRGKRGVINIVHGPEIFPDTNAHGQGENPQVVYSVRFAARELWGDSAEPRQTLSIDLWESYLEPAST